jgi:GNAT superfamily N-acetyltransferase
MITTHPAHQHRGAGSMLVKWGTEIADAMRVECFIEGTALAKRLYESCGFVTVPKGMITIPVPEKFMDKPVIQYYFYERPAKAEKATE